MKRLIPALVLFCAIACQNKDIVTVTDASVLSIERRLPMLKKIEKELLGHSTEGGTLSGYYENVNLQKMKAEFFGEMGKSSIHFYFKDQKLIYAFEENYIYNAPIFMDAQTAKVMGVEAFDVNKTRLNENEYYFKDEKLIKWISNKKVMGEDKEALRHNALRLLGVSEDYATLLFE